MKGKQVLYAVLKIQPEQWPIYETTTRERNKDLKEKLGMLPISWDIDFDPEDVS